MNLSMEFSRDREILLGVFAPLHFRYYYVHLNDTRYFTLLSKRVYDGVQREKVRFEKLLPTRTPTGEDAIMA